jgi:hypothetical protein
VLRETTSRGLCGLVPSIVGPLGVASGADREIFFKKNLPSYQIAGKLKRLEFNCRL